MKQLTEFDTILEARQYTTAKGTMIHRNTMNAWLSSAGKYRRLKEIALDPLHPLGDGVAAFLDSTEYNLIQSNETGREVIALMQALVQEEGSDELQEVLDKAISKANPIYKSYEKVSEYDWAKAKRINITQKHLTPSDGWVSINVLSDVEKHNPQIYIKVQEVFHRVAGFNSVEDKGKYIAQVPKNNSIVYVDDYYKVIE